MSNYPYKFIPCDVSKLPNGIWKTEKIKSTWIDRESGYRCAIVRHTRMGHLCGYVKVPQEHSFVGKNVSDCVQVSDEVLKRHIQPGKDVGYIALVFAQNIEDGFLPIDLAVSVHGGLTYSQCDEDMEWWLGFDCSHCDDICPGYWSSDLDRDREYRDWNYVERQCNRLANQLKEFEQLTITNQ
jgi:hypothetical protein